MSNFKSREQIGIGIGAGRCFAEIVFVEKVLTFFPIPSNFLTLKGQSDYSLPF